MLTQTYSFIIKRIPRGLDIFTSKIKNVMFLFLNHVFGLDFPEAIKQ